jgi:hypothetical protein
VAEEVYKINRIYSGLGKKEGQKWCDLLIFKKYWHQKAESDFILFDLTCQFLARSIAQINHTGTHQK